MHPDIDTSWGPAEAITKPSPAPVEREGVERYIRIAIWNACRWQGRPQEVAQSFIQQAMAEPAMQRALAALAPEPVREQFAENAKSYDEAVATIRAGIRSFISCEPDIDLSPGLERSLAEHILGQQGGRAAVSITVSAREGE